MILDLLSREDVELVRHWRDSCLETLRTSYRLSKEQQIGFYNELVYSKHLSRYWALKVDAEELQKQITKGLNITQLVGMGGLQNIEWENRRAEISLIIDPVHKGKGFGQQAVDLLLDQAFNYMGLLHVWGEVYDTNEKSKQFWLKIIKKYNGFTAFHPAAKFWKGLHYSALWFQISRHDFNKEK